MTPVHTVPASGMAGLLAGFSLEMTGQDIEQLEAAHGAIPPGTRINVTFLEHEDLRLRLSAARAARRLGFVPVPHISARRLRSPDRFIRALVEGYHPGRHGQVKLHFYPFGGLRATAEWIAGFARKER
jgi:methylenetetrahydrofolate reductase (NADPH)